MHLRKFFKMRGRFNCQIKCACHTRKFFLVHDLSFSPRSLAVLPVSRSSSLLMSSSSLFGFVLMIRYGIVMGNPTVKARTLYPEIDETEFNLCSRAQCKID